MSLCINTKCELAKNQVDQGQNLFCSGCGSSLLINDIYRVLRYLGLGGFGWTALVDDGGSLKVLKVLHNTDSKAISLFDQEAEVLQRLNHAGIPKVEVGGRFNYYPKGSNIPLRCLIMEFIEGENLENYLEKRNYRPISEQAAVRWLRELVEILDLVHRANYFHRDIKPANIMLRNTGQLALIDFGTAREETQTYLQKQQGQAVTGIISVGYTPHEQSNGQAEYRSDFFALGRTFVFLLTGKHPHEFIESLKRGLQWQEDAQSYSQVLRDFIDRLMYIDVEDRPHNTQAVLRELTALEKKYRSVSNPKLISSSKSPLLLKTTENTVVQNSIKSPKKLLIQKLLFVLVVVSIVPLSFFIFFYLSGLFVTFLVTSVTLFLISKLPTGVEISSFQKALVSAIVFGLLNAFVRPVIAFFALPITFLTFGLFSVIINAIIFGLAAALVDGFSLRWGFWSALIGAFLLGFINSVIYRFLPI